MFSISRCTHYYILSVVLKNQANYISVNVNFFLVLLTLKKEISLPINPIIFSKTA